MNFAVVTFPEEDDALGIIPMNWIVGNGVCKYPIVKSDFTKNKMISAMVEPKKEWLECKIRILHKYGMFK
jgi:hypothetical protein